MSITKKNDFFSQTVLGHPAGLFVLFFTEMWERFSYYGMRAILVLFLTSKLVDGGWEWSNKNALALYGTYTACAYLSSMFGGFLADKYLGLRKAVILGSALMTLGHAAMALNMPIFMYIGLFLLVAGNGFFKPSMTSITSQMYVDHPEKKDGAFTIFYMGVNSGAFFGMLICGYLGEKVGWHYGFGLAGIFMFFGTIMFYLYQRIFGDIGLTPEDQQKLDIADDGDKKNPFTTMDQILISLTALVALVWVFNDPIAKISDNAYNIFGNSTNAGYAILAALISFLFILFSRILRYSPITRDRMLAVFFIALFYMLFWAAFEQSNGSMTIFADAYTDRSLEGSFGFGFKIFNALLTIIPLGILTWVLYMLVQKTKVEYPSAMISITLSFLIIWAIVLYMTNKEFSSDSSEIPASWFSALNSFFIITLAPIFSKVWESKLNPPAAIKYAFGMLFLGLGFYALSFGAKDIPNGAASASVGIQWLIIAYLFHTMGELCISPVGLSYVSKLVPGRMIAIMFGIWYIAIAVGNKIAGTMGGEIEKIGEENGLSYFFMIFTVIPIGAAVVLLGLNPLFKKLMHGVK
jgi:proton-dependent oligopeptide transporter, POT family